MIPQAEETIRAAAARFSGLELTRVAEVRGTFAAVFSYQVNPTFTKGFGTRWYPTLSELQSIVLDTLLHFQGDFAEMNIFSAEMFEYLAAEMLPADKPISMTIKSVKEDKVAGPRGEQVKVIIGFKERPKKLILNKTNARALAKALTPETDNWIGATVVLGVESVKVGKNVVPSIRVKSATPGKRQQPAATAQGNGQRGNRPAMANTPGDDPALRNAPAGDESQAELFAT